MSAPVRRRQQREPRTAGEKIVRGPRLLLLTRPLLLRSIKLVKESAAVLLHRCSAFFPRATARPLLACGVQPAGRTVGMLLLPTTLEAAAPSAVRTVGTAGRRG